MAKTRQKELDRSGTCSEIISACWPKGLHVQTWINGQPIESLMDEDILKTHPKSSLALHVHGIKKGGGPHEVAWRNLWLRELK